METIEPSSRPIDLEGLVVTPIAEILGDVGDLEGDVPAEETEETEGDGEDDDAEETEEGEPKE